MTEGRRFAAVLGLLVWFSCAWFGASEFNPNNVTRLAAAVSIVEDRDATIDEYNDVTIDKARFGTHVYMDKAPGMTLMAVPWVWIADQVTRDNAGNYSKSYFGDLWRFLRLRMRLATAFGSAILTALAAVAMLALANEIGGSRSAGLFAALGYALGTPVWGWSTSLFGHAVVADMLVIGIWAIWRATATGQLRYAIVAGASLGWSVTVEAQSLLWLAFLGPWAMARVWPNPARWRLLGTAAIAGSTMLAPLALYNLFAFGTPFRLGYQGVVGFEGMNRGILGVSWPDPKLIPQLLFGPYRGLFWVAPILMLGTFGLAWLARQRETRGIGLAAGGVALAALLYNAGYYYWDGGYSTGPRHMIPAAGMLALGLAPVWRMLDPGRERIAAAAFLGVSIALNLAIAASEIAAPDLFAHPLTEHVLPLFLDGKFRAAGSEWLDWPTWVALLFYLIPALAALTWLIRKAKVPQ